MDELKLAALDAEDLQIVSAHVQDAVMKVADLDYRRSEKRFLLAMNRFAWEKAGGFFSRHKERRRSVLSFDRVLSVKSAGFDRGDREHVLSLLAVSFSAADTPAGFVDLTFSEGGTLRLEVECIEARLADLGAAWEARSRPVHRP